MSGPPRRSLTIAATCIATLPPNTGGPPENIAPKPKPPEIERTSQRTRAQRGPSQFCLSQSALAGRPFRAENGAVVVNEPALKKFPGHSFPPARTYSSSGTPTDLASAPGFRCGSAERWPPTPHSATTSETSRTRSGLSTPEPAADNQALP